MATWWPLALVVFGLWSSISPFSLAYWLATAAFAGAVARKIGRHGAAVATCVGAVGTWTAIFLSERRLPQTYPLELGNPNAEAGFPFIAFRYPVPPMGNDVPPLAQWPTFFADYAVWLALGLALTPWLVRLLPERRCRTPLLVFFVILFGVLGLGHTMLKFD